MLTDDESQIFFEARIFQMLHDPCSTNALHNLQAVNLLCFMLSSLKHIVIK